MLIALLVLLHTYVMPIQRIDKNPRISTYLRHVCMRGYISSNPYGLLPVYKNTRTLLLSVQCSMFNSYAQSMRISTCAVMMRRNIDSG